MRLLLLAALLGCGARTVDRVEQLKAPWYAYVEQGVDTSSTVALDGDGVVWRAFSGPIKTQPLTAGRTATASQQAAVTSAFAALPAGSSTTCTNSHAFLRTATTSWGVCFDDQGNIDPTWAPAVAAMQQL